MNVPARTSQESAFAHTRAKGAGYGVSSPVIWPMAAMDTFKGTASVDAPVLRKLAVSQLRLGAEMANANGSATHSTP